MTPRGRIVVIGTGAAGTAAARSLSLSGWDVTVIERAKAGGTCLWWGCMPKKALYNSARYLRGLGRAEMFGLNGAEGFDWQSVLAWKWHAQETYAGDQIADFASRNIRYIPGDARFTGLDEVEVTPIPEQDPATRGNSGSEPERITFDHAIVATGSRPVMPAIDGIELADTSTDALGYPSPPHSLLVVGGGFIAFELAAVYATFGTKVSIVTSGHRPLEMVDEEIATVAVRRLERLGVEIHSSCRLSALTGSPGAIEAAVTQSDGLVLAGTWDRVLVAVGRQPALDGLDLDVAGVQLTGNGAPVVDDALCSTNPAVWFAGDASGGLMQTPAANYMGRTVASSIDSAERRVVDTSLIPTCTFTTPQIAQVGLTEAEAHAAGIEASVGRAPFDYSGAAVVEDERDGLVKLVFAEEDGRLLGAQVAGPTASDLIYAMAVALRHGATRDTLRTVVGIHPAYCEMFHRASF